MTNSTSDKITAVALILLFYSMVATVLVFAASFAYVTAAKELHAERVERAAEDSGWQKFADNSAQRLRDANERARLWQEKYLAIRPNRPTGMPTPTGAAPPN